MSGIKIHLLNIVVYTFFLSVMSASAAPLSGTYNVGTGQTYTTLTHNNGFFAAVNANGLSGNVIVLITSNLNEDANTSLNQWTETGAGRYTITITSSAATVRVISGSVAKPLINFNGADRVTFDGRFGGSGNYLTFRNTNGNYPTVNFQNDAIKNTFTYCTIESNDGGPLGTTGTIVFGSTNRTSGNDSNTVSYCNIRDRSDATGTPITAIYASGNTTHPNINNIITNCNIFNTYNAASTWVDMYIVDGNSDWTISNNSFYQSTSRTPGAGVAYFGIILATSGNNMLISGNYFGGSLPNCAGIPMTIMTGSGLFPFRIFQVGTTTATVVSNNTISNIDCTLNSSGDYFFFRGIDVNISGLVNLTGNTIGSTTASNSIVLRYSGTSGNPQPCAIAYAYDWLGTSTVTGSILNNNIGGISLTGTGSTTGNMDLIGIMAGYGTAYYASSVTISGNTIGSNLTSNFQNVLNVNTTFMGINTNVSSPGVVTVSNNTIRNLTDGTTNNSASLRGIYHNGTASFTCTGNTITALNTNSTNITGTTGNNPNNSVNGISTGNNSTGVNTFTSNTISAIRNLTSGATNVSTKGLVITGNCTGSINRNSIYDLTNVSTGTSASIFGLYTANGTMTAANNMISITNGELTDNKTGTLPVPGINPPIVKEESESHGNNPGNTNNLTTTNAPRNNQAPPTDRAPKNDGSDSFNGTIIQGIHDEGGHTWNYYYNTVYIGGSVNSGTNLSSCYTRDILATTVTMTDNLFFNARTGNGTHLAINNNIAGTSFTNNYNVLISSNANTIGRWLGTNETFAAWKTSDASDKLSWSTISGSLSASNLFSSISTGNLRINSANTEAWIVSGKGIAIASVNSDIDGNSRATTIAGGCTDIGAKEFAATPPNCPAATVNNPPGSGVTSTYTLWGRTIAVINWGTGGSSYPTTANIQYYSGVNPPNVLGGNYSNSNWVVSNVGTLTGANYDITYYFGDNETYTITTPSSNTRLAKYNTSWEVFSATGTGIYQTDLTWANLTIKTRGISTFSTYALTDITGPLPVTMLYFNGNVIARNVKLNWATSIETNNKGFEIQRRNLILNNNYSEWQPITFINGQGTTNQQTDYSYTDNKLSTGTYQYRLKQVDFNGNSEFFNLNSPSSLVVGTPVAFDVSQNYPNPSNPSTKIDYQIPFAGKVSLKIYDVSGREVSTLLDKNLDAGYYTSEFNSTNLSSGVYFYRLISSSDDGRKFSKTMKMVVVK